jgi:hypothetical protein
MGSGAMIYIPSFMKTGSGIPKLMGGLHRHTEHRQQGDFICLLLFFKIRKVDKELVLEKRVGYI